MEIQTILIPTDCSELSKDALKTGIDFSKKFNAKIILLYVGSEIPVIPYEDLGCLPTEVAANLIETSGQRHRTELENFWNSHYDSSLNIELVVETGDPFTEIITFAKKTDIDLIIMGTHGRKGIKHAFMGSVAEKVVRYSPYPVLTIKHPGVEFEELKK